MLSTYREPSNILGDTVVNKTHGIYSPMGQLGVVSLSQGAELEYFVSNPQNKIRY